MVTTIEDDRILRVLENTIEWMNDPENQERMDQWDHVGFGATDVKANGWEFKKLLQEGLIEQTYSSNAGTQYRVVHIDDAKQTLSASQSPEEILETTREAEDIDPEELFNDVVGREKPKKWLRRTIDRGEQVHHLLHGPPGSGKSMVTDDIARLPGAKRVVLSGDSATAVGIRDTLLENPHYLIVEEIEKGSKGDRESLMTACGEGYVKVTKSGVDKRVDLNTTVVATSNDIEAITPASLVDRFMQWRFDQYNRDEFVEVCVEILPRDHNVSVGLARYIAEQVYVDLDTTQVREAKRIAALADNEEEVDELIASIA